MEATAVITPTTGKLAVTKNEIKEASLKYCVETLANNVPVNDMFKAHIEDKKIEVKQFLKLKGGHFEAKEETFFRNITKFKMSGGKNYDFLTKAGDGFQMTVFKFCQKMFQEETFPSDFLNTTLHMIFKGGNSRREILSEHRFIHSKYFFARAAKVCW